MICIQMNLLKGNYKWCKNALKNYKKRITNISILLIIIIIIIILMMDHFFLKMRRIKNGSIYFKLKMN